MKDAVQLIRETQAATKTVVNLCLLEGWTQSPTNNPKPNNAEHWRIEDLQTTGNKAFCWNLQKSTAIWQTASLFFVELYMCWPLHSAMDSYPSHLYL